MASKIVSFQKLNGGSNGGGGSKAGDGKANGEDGDEYETYEVREEVEVEAEVEVDEDGNEIPTGASIPAARGGKTGEATAASKRHTLEAEAEAVSEGRVAAAKRAVAAARHEALKRISLEKAEAVTRRFQSTAGFSPNDLL